MSKDTKVDVNKRQWEKPNRELDSNYIINIIVDFKSMTLCSYMKQSNYINHKISTSYIKLYSFLT